MLKEYSQFMSSSGNRVLSFFDYESHCDLAFELFVGLLTSLQVVFKKLQSSVKFAHVPLSLSSGKDKVALVNYITSII
jgi:hypothetical protein